MVMAYMFVQDFQLRIKTAAHKEMKVLAGICFLKGPSLLGLNTFLDKWPSALMILSSTAWNRSAAE
jgi:hypothetical protein